MSNTDEDELFLTTAQLDGCSCTVTVRVEFDGVEHIGHLVFRDADWEEDIGVRDHGPIPGRDPDDVLRHARTLTDDDLTLRYRRAMADRRRFNGLRHVTQQVLDQIRYLNKVATSMRAGLLDVNEAASEIDGTEQRLHEMIGQLRLYAGVES